MIYKNKFSRKLVSLHFKNFNQNIWEMTKHERSLKIIAEESSSEIIKVVKLIQLMKMNTRMKMNIRMNLHLNNK